MGLIQRKEKDEEQITILKIKTQSRNMRNYGYVKSQKNWTYMGKIH